jgi:hypothetical protein
MEPWPTVAHSEFTGNMDSPSDFSLIPEWINGYMVVG